MTILELKDQIMHKKLSNFYVFTGTEIGIMNIYLNQMSQVYGLPIIRASSVASIYSRCTTRSMFGDVTGFYVIRNDTDFTKQDSVFSTIASSIGNNIIVLLFDKIDSRLKFGKAFKDCTIQFDKLATNVLKSYIKKKCKVSDKHAEDLIELVGGSYDLAMLECDKIKQYSQAMNYDDDYSMSKLMTDGQIYQPENSDVFKFTDAVLSNRPTESFRIARILSENGVSAINSLGTLYNSMKTVMLIQCCPKGSNVCDVTGLDNKQVYFNKKYVGIYDIQTLVFAVKLLYKVIDGIKTGWIDEQYAVNFVLVNIF